MVGRDLKDHIVPAPQPWAGVLTGFALQDFGNGRGAYRGGFCEKLLKASPMSNRAHARGTKTDPPWPRPSPSALSVALVGT